MEDLGSFYEIRKGGKQEMTVPMQQRSETVCKKLGKAWSRTSTVGTNVSLPMIYSGAWGS